MEKRTFSNKKELIRFLEEVVKRQSEFVACHINLKDNHALEISLKYFKEAEQLETQVCYDEDGMKHCFLIENEKSPRLFDEVFQLVIDHLENDQNDIIATLGRMENQLITNFPKEILEDKFVSNSQIAYDKKVETYMYGNENPVEFGSMQRLSCSEDMILELVTLMHNWLVNLAYRTKEDCKLYSLFDSLD